MPIDILNYSVNSNVERKGKELKSDESERKHLLKWQT